MTKEIINPSFLVIKLAQSEDEKIKFANLALKHRLYVSGWCLSKRLTAIRISDNSLDYEVCMAFYNDLPVGVSIICHYDINWNYDNFGMFFVKKSYRCNGIATNMLKVISKKISKNKITCASATLSGSMFFDKVGIRNIGY